MDYIPVDKLKAEIERQQRSLMLLSNTEVVSMRRDCALQNGVYVHILGIIDALQQEQPEVDLDEKIESYFKGFGKFASVGIDDCVDIAKHFYELGLNTRKED